MKKAACCWGRMEQNGCRLKGKGKKLCLAMTLGVGDDVAAVTLQLQLPPEIGNPVTAEQKGIRLGAGHS